MPKLSIVVPIYNKERYLSECLDSILAQTYRDFELILVDDGSKDASGTICDQYAELDNRILVIHKPNGGVSSARNAGIELAKGEYIGFVDSDDILSKTMYQHLIDNLEKYQADISICGVERISETTIQKLEGPKELEIYSKEQALEKFLRGKILMSTYEKIFKRCIIASLRYEPPLFEDTFYNFQAILNSNTIVQDPTVLYSYMIRENSSSMAPFNQQYMNTLILSDRIVQICRSEFPQFAKLAEEYSFNQNMFVLNLILVSSVSKYNSEYLTVKNNLAQFQYFTYKSKRISRKYRMGYTVFRISPFIYRVLTNLYGIIMQSEHIIRRNKSK